MSSYPGLHPIGHGREAGGAVEGVEIGGYPSTGAVGEEGV